MSDLRRCCAAALVALAALAALVSAAAAEPQFPTLSGRVVDNANLLSAEDRAAITDELAALEAKSTDQLVVVTVPSLDGYEIEDYGHQLGRHWGIGQAGKDNGVLLIVAPNQRKVRIEVGRRLEPLLTDLMSKLIVENAILPAFRRGDFPAGIRAGVRDVKDVLLGDAEAVKERAKGIGGQGPDYVAWFMVAFWITVVLIIIYFQVRQAMLAPQTIRQRGRGRFRDTGVIVPAGSGSGNWDGGWSGGSGGGGGWSGGGGSFGGGGASGSW